MCVRVFVAKKTLTLAKKTHLTNKKYIRRSLKNLFANVRPWIGKFAVGPKKSLEVGPSKKIRDRSGMDPGRVHYPDPSIPASILFSASSGTDDTRRVVSRIGM